MIVSTLAHISVELHKIQAHCRQLLKNPDVNCFQKENIELIIQLCSASEEIAAYSVDSGFSNNGEEKNNSALIEASINKASRLLLSRTAIVPDVISIFEEEVIDGTQDSF